MKDQNIVCTYCGETYEPTYDDTWIGGKKVDCYTDDSQTVECDNCGKKFNIYGFVSWMYETKEVEEWEEWK